MHAREWVACKLPTRWHYATRAKTALRKADIRGAYP